MTAASLCAKMMSKSAQLASVMLLAFMMAAGIAEEQTPASTVAGFDTDRVPLLTVVPVYPKNAKRDRVEGEVQVCFNVDREGKTYRLTVRSSTHRIFEKPSIKAVRDSTYLPLSKGTVVPGIKSCRTFRFFLEPIAIDALDSSDYPF